MKYTYEDFDNYTLEESLEILKKETKARKIDAEDLIADIEDELKNQDENVEKCNELIREVVDRLNEIYNVFCPLCGDRLIHEEHNGTHIYYCEPCPFIGFEYVDHKDLENLTKWLEER